MRQALRAARTDAFVVLRRGRIAAEWYDNGMDATTPHIVFSVSKSICGTLGGILAGRGLLDPDDRVIDYVPELASSVYAGCTIRHLLGACPDRHCDGHLLQVNRLRLPLRG